LLHDFTAKFDDLQRLKACIAFLVNPFVVDVISNILRSPTMLLTETSAAEIGNPRGSSSSRRIWVSV
jgi:hypothetical protein